MRMMRAHQPAHAPSLQGSGRRVQTGQRGGEPEGEGGTARQASSPEPEESAWRGNLSATKASWAQHLRARPPATAGQTGGGEGREGSMAVRAEVSDSENDKATDAGGGTGWPQRFRGRPPATAGPTVLVGAGAGTTHPRPQTQNPDTLEPHPTPLTVVSLNSRPRVIKKKKK